MGNIVRVVKMYRLIRMEFKTSLNEFISVMEEWFFVFITILGSRGIWLWVSMDRTTLKTFGFLQSLVKVDVHNPSLIGVTSLWNILTLGRRHANILPKKGTVLGLDLQCIGYWFTDLLQEQHAEFGGRKRTHDHYRAILKIIGILQQQWRPKTTSRDVNYVDDQKIWD